jgi:hypothetical protein
MGFQFVVMFIVSFMGDVIGARKVKFYTVRYKEYLMDIVWFERIDI